jgi:tyrosyl-tRNA synthetase
MKSEDIPTTTYPASRFAEGVDLITMMCDAKLATSRSDARRNIEQGGVTVNDMKVTDFAKAFTEKDFDADGALLVKKGKKAFHRFMVE